MKGIVLAGGTGSRLDPLTRITNKHLLPVYDRPMVVYSIDALRTAGVSELMLVTWAQHVDDFRRLLGDDLAYRVHAPAGRSPPCLLRAATVPAASPRLR